jgi:multiple antibiotic resistance protein
MIGPGTISISIIAGKRLPISFAVAAITMTLTVTVLILILLKVLHDFVSKKNESLVEQYIELSGKITAIVLGTYSIDMIMSGIKAWISVLNAST